MGSVINLVFFIQRVEYSMLHPQIPQGDGSFNGQTLNCLNVANIVTTWRNMWSSQFCEVRLQHTQIRMWLNFVCLFRGCFHYRGWPRPCLSHLLCLEDYGWPITLLLSLINEDNELPLLPMKPQCSSAGTEEQRVCVGYGLLVRKRYTEWAKGVMMFTKLKHRNGFWPKDFVCTFV